MIASLSQIVVVPCSTTIRGLPWEVLLDEQDGLAVRCTLKLEWIRAVDRAAMGARIATLPEGRWAEVRRALVDVLGLEVDSDRR